MEKHSHHGQSGCLILGEDVKFKKNVSFDITGNITIGEGTQIGEGVKIFTHKHDYKVSKTGNRIFIKDLVVGEDVRILTNSIIICIASIGDGAVIGAGSVVTKDIPAYEIWAGNPAKRIGFRG